MYCTYASKSVFILSKLLYNAALCSGVWCSWLYASTHAPFSIRYFNTARQLSPLIAARWRGEWRNLFVLDTLEPRQIEENIRIYHECEGKIEKCVPLDHRLSSRGL